MTSINKTMSGFSDIFRLVIKICNSQELSKRVAQVVAMLKIFRISKFSDTVHVVIALEFYGYENPSVDIPY